MNQTNSEVEKRLPEQASVVTELQTAPASVLMRGAKDESVLFARKLLKMLSGWPKRHERYPLVQ